MKRFLASAALVIGTACGPRSAPTPAARAAAGLGPQETLQLFYDDLAAGDLDGARALMLPLSDVERRRQLEVDLSEAAVKFQDRELGAKAVESKADEPWAVVVARHVRYEGGAEAEVLLRDEFLYRTPEGWRLASEAAREDPAIAPLWDARAAELLNWYRVSFDDLSARYR
jgi:hypothetical protein